MTDYTVWEMIVGKFYYHGMEALPDVIMLLESAFKYVR